MAEKNSLHSEYDLIGEALDDAICNGDGRPTAKHLLIELEHRGLTIVAASDVAAAPELLEALQALLPEGWADDDTMDHIPGVKQARAALAKATGAA